MRRKSKDKFTRKQRSLLMAKIKGSDTGLEKVVFDGIKRSGLKVSKRNDFTLPGKPDFVFKPQKLVVFVHGDFWHGWQFPRWKQRLKNSYWKLKIEGNRRRDRRIVALLRRRGWKVMTVWEHQVMNDKLGTMSRLKSALG